MPDLVLSTRPPQRWTRSDHIEIAPPPGWLGLGSQHFRDGRFTHKAREIVYWLERK